MKPPEWFEADRAAVDAALEALLPAETVLPASIHRAMRYSVFAGGKRIRPILCLETARIFDRDGLDAMPAACSLEFIHTYSLIHDDLPALDNDDLRRGKPTSHKVFGEAIAILTGDALLTFAFQTLAGASIEPSRRVRVIAEIGAAAGTVNGMVGGLGGVCGSAMAMQDREDRAAAARLEVRVGIEPTNKGFADLYPTPAIAHTVRKIRVVGIGVCPIFARSGSRK